MVSSQPEIALVVAGILIFLSVPITQKVAAKEGDPSLKKLMMWSATLHLLSAPIQIWVVDHYYKGITDYNRYVGQGAVLAHRFDALHFSLAGTNVSPLGSGSVSIAAGVVFAIVGVNKLAGFFVFAWLAFIASIFFYRAFSVTFPEANCRRYARLLFFLPSLLFWTAGVSKETVMYLALGIAAYGAACIISQKRGGAIFLAIGTGIGVYVRPQELLLFVSVVAVATLFRRRSSRGLSVVRRVLVIGAQVILILGALALTNQLAKHGAPVYNLNQIAQNNSGQSSSVHYSSSPAYYPHDVYVVMLDPLPVTAHTNGQRVAAIENSILLIIAILSHRRLRRIPKAAVLRPYVMVSLLFSAGFCYAFASLGNLGLIDRERVLMLPFFLVLLALPVAHKGDPPVFEWEMTRKQRRKVFGRGAHSRRTVPRF
jgi:hypothetical protein